MSLRHISYFVDLTLRDDVTLKQAVRDAQGIDKKLIEHGFDQAALEVATKLGYVNSCFEVDSDGLLGVAEKFYFMETDDVSSYQHGNYQNGLATQNVTSIEQGLRKSVTVVS